MAATALYLGALLLTLDDVKPKGCRNLCHQHAIMPLMQLAVIRERVHGLQQEISRLRVENASYLRKHLHSALEAREHRLREERLQEIVEELGRLTKTKIL